MKTSILNFIKFTKNNPFLFIVLTVINILCYSFNDYNKLFDSNFYNFLLCEICILIMCLILYLDFKNKL